MNKFELSDLAEFRGQSVDSVIVPIHQDDTWRSPATIIQERSPKS